MIREPGGCFEQTSSTNYPNVMVLQLPRVERRRRSAARAEDANEQLDHGYKLLTGYETPEQGLRVVRRRSPGHEALTAYGLMEFADMAKVYEVDTAMVERTANWLMSRRDGKGGFQRSSRGARLVRPRRAETTTTRLHHVGARPRRSARRASTPELTAQQTLGASTTDPYLLALATNTALNVKPADGADAV